MDTNLQERLRRLPKVEEVLTRPTTQAMTGVIPREFVVDCVRDAIDEVRQALKDGVEVPVNPEAIEAAACARAISYLKPSLRRVVNASGIVIHTNLGRSILAQEAVDAVVEVARGYSTLEFDTAKAARGSRHDHCRELICALTGAEDAIAVNNNAAAVMMVLNEFARDREVIVSRGELVEIGGSFRIPDIMALSGATMVEVGTTNKTHLYDYQRALTPKCGMLLKVHPSNYRMIGFTESVDMAELRDLAREVNQGREPGEEVIVYEDQGSGALLSLDCFGDYAEPTVARSLARGVDLVSFSGDKLLGGPQAGIIAGRADLIARLKANPMARALRLDKMTLAALEATLRIYMDPAEALRAIPTLRMLSEPVEDVAARAEALAARLTDAFGPEVAKVSLVDDVTYSGGGALPMCPIPTKTVHLELVGIDPQHALNYLVGTNFIPVVCRIRERDLIFDAKALLGDDDYQVIADAVAAFLRDGKRV